MCIELITLSFLVTNNKITKNVIENNKTLFFFNNKIKMLFFYKKEVKITKLCWLFLYNRIMLLYYFFKLTIITLTTDFSS